MRWLLQANKLVELLTVKSQAASLQKNAFRLQSPYLGCHSLPASISLLPFSSSSSKSRPRQPHPAIQTGIPCQRLWRSSALEPLFPPQYWNLNKASNSFFASTSFYVPVRHATKWVTRVFNPMIAERDKMERMHRTGPIKKKRNKKKALDGKPMMKGVVLKTLIKKPRKPNSANRKCVLLRLSNGKEAVAYVPGIGHNLQEHNIVLVRCGRLQDVPGVKIKVIRGKYDCAHIKKKAAT